MDILTAIHSRRSIRHYQRKAVPGDILNDVIAYGQKSVALDDSIPVKFHLVEGTSIAGQMLYMTGTRLLFGSAPHFIIAVSEEMPFFMVNMGFRMEQMIIHATQSGLGTCWIGGMFDEKRLSQFLKLESNQRVIAMTPIGYPDMSFYGRLARNVIEIGAVSFGRRKPLDQVVYGERWGLPLDTGDGELIKALECARLSPSWANTQPWRFLADSSMVIAMADTKRRYANIRQGKHYYRLDVGIAMANFYLAAKEMGWSGRWQITGFDPAEIAVSGSVPGGYEIVARYERLNPKSEARNPNPDKPEPNPCPV